MYARIFIKEYSRNSQKFLIILIAHGYNKRILRHIKKRKSYLSVSRLLYIQIYTKEHSRNSKEKSRVLCLLYRLILFIYLIYINYSELKKKYIYIYNP